MRKAIPIVALLLMAPAAFAQSNNEPLGGKVNEPVPATTKKTVPKTSSRPNKPLSSPCGAGYRNSNATDKWFSIGESASKHFWYNPSKTACDTKTGALKSWFKEEHKDTDGNYALVLYEFKCNTNQIRVKTVIEYDSAGSLLETTNHDNDPWQDVAPGTAGAVMIRIACRKP
jgi:hypothetical protein